MTDNEIFETEIKCINRRSSGKCNGGTDCYKCDLLMNEKDIISAYERAIANSNLINQLQLEIEELKIENKSLRSAANCYKLHYIEARPEAIKEFAEKLKKCYDNPVWYLGGSNGFFDNLDNFVKEMVGDTE